MAFESASYLVMEHYSLSLTDLSSLTEDQFSQMLCWAAAAKKMEAEANDKAMRESNSQQRVAGTDGSKPMPGSEGW